MDVCVSACLSRGPERTIVRSVDGTSGAGQAAPATMGRNASIVESLQGGTWRGRQRRDAKS